MDNKRELAWETVKEFYKNYFGISSWAVEMMADRDILYLCASGASNKTISIFLDINLDSVNDVIKRVLKFDGWIADLPINPYSSLLDNPDPSDFIAECSEVLSKYPEFASIDLKFLYEVCSLVSDIERKVLDEWK